jgi:NAD(P)-dependent dehydrogenase (short-subunit alcohol dehydrogenase family)
MDLELEGKVAVVTGASKGIGLAVAQTLAAEGVRVVAASRTRTPELDALDVHHVAVDLMDPDAPAEVVAHAVEAFGGVDLLINNAGGPPPGDRLPHGGFLTRSDEHWRAMLDFNVLSAVRACRAAIPLMLEGSGGAIVNVASATAASRPRSTSTTRPPRRRSSTSPRPCRRSSVAAACGSTPSAPGRP